MSPPSPTSAAPASYEAHDVGDAYLHLDSQLLALLHSTSTAVAQLQDPASIGRRIVETTESLMPLGSGFLVAIYLNDNGPRILAHSDRGHDGVLLDPDSSARIESALRGEPDRGIISRTLRSARTFRSGDVTEVVEFIDVFGGVRSCLCVPAVSHGMVVGAINVESTASNAFGDREETALQIIANQLAVAIENARLLAEARHELALRRQAEIQLRSLNKRLGQLASHDDLTQLTNRREFHLRLARALETTRKYGGEHALCIVDLDRFKSVNDVGGHAAGDALLQKLAKRLSAVVRNRDTLARLGGDEFGVFMEHCTTDEALRVANNMCATIGELSMDWDDRRFNVTASVGITALNEGSESVNEVIRKADAACYVAKHAGGDRVHTADSASAVMHRRDQDNQALAAFRMALANADGVWLEAQPIRELGDTGRAAFDVEILARLRMPDGSELYPRDFLGAVERFKLAPILDQRVIERTAAWLRTNPAFDGRPVKAHVNLSGQSLGDAQFLQYLHTQITSGKIASSQMGFEITETAAIGDLYNALRGIGMLRDMGCTFAIDDFGTGLASIGYLRELPIDSIKIDGLFVRGLAHSEQDQTLVALMNDVAHSFGLRTVAECIETEEDLAAIRKLGLDAAQGYFVGSLCRLPDENRPRNQSARQDSTPGGR